MTQKASLMTNAKGVIENEVAATETMNLMVNGIVNLNEKDYYYGRC